MSRILDMATGRGLFAVDEEFVKSNLQGLTEEDRALMDVFVGQSLHKDDEEEEEVEEDDEVIVKKALFKIGSLRQVPGDESPLRDGVFQYKNPQYGEFDFDGQLVATDGPKGTKLTKIYKRRDNKGKLFEALHNMKLD